MLFQNCIQGQELPEFVKNRLNSEKTNAEKYLNNYRISSKLYPPTRRLSSIFSDIEKKIIDSLGLKLDLSMVYDDDIRERMVELLENKYRQYELDTLIERWVSDEDDIYKRQTIEICRFDTISIFKKILDSLNKINYLDVPENKRTVLALLKLDTTTTYKNNFIKIKNDKRKEVENLILNNPYYNNTYIAELCGYIGDRKFIKPLEKALELSENFNTKVVLEALVRMKVEPYYTNYLKSIIRPIDSVKNSMLHFFVLDFVDVLNNQEAYLEVSKYLLSNVAGAISIIDYKDGTTGNSKTPIYVIALDYIRLCIKNPSLQKIINAPTFDEKKESDRMKVYKWMQKNYGKYEIRRLW